jgi:hypothetical protein
VVCCIETTLCSPPPRLNRSGTCSGSPYAILSIDGVRERYAIVIIMILVSVQLARHLDFSSTVAFLLRSCILPEPGSKSLMMRLKEDQGDNDVRDAPDSSVVPSLLDLVQEVRNTPDNAVLRLSEPEERLAYRHSFKFAFIGSQRRRTKSR